MALTKAATAALEALASEIESAASWHSGPRHNRLLELARKARGIADGSIGAEDIEAVANASTVAPPSTDTESDKKGKT